MKGLVWVLLAVLLGIVVGWLLRSVAAKRQVERARAANLGTADRDELERLRQRVANLEPIVADRDRLRSELDDARGDDSPATAPVPAQSVATVPVAPGAPENPPATMHDAPETMHDAETFDLGAAAAAIGKPIVADDLTVVEGIGPKIAELCHGIGITTWSDLAETEVSLLRTMLNDAGQRFKAHDPSSWPQQAALLAVGAWDDFAALAERLDGGRPVG
jgi:predicted flap endonuclease-1-like 5' DNA nuclease